jgi:hypothetical protein
MAQRLASTVLEDALNLKEKTQNMSDLERDLIQFFQACLPPLFPGDYTIRVDQTVREIRPEKPFETELDFSVAGPRFSLNPADVYSVYPPANQPGEFGNTLPQIVFCRRTLPWERTIDGQDRDVQNPCPWLALLVFSPSDFGKEGRPPEIKTRKVGELFNPADEDESQGPELEEADLKDYESLNDLCNTIDLPADLFSKVVPAEADLPFLAHVRQVNTENKETLSFKSEGCFAVVMANRLPETTTAKAGIKNTVFLVSLEGFQKYLYGKPQTITAKKVRLAVLASWDFICHGKNNFKNLMNELKEGRLNRPVSPELEKQAAAGDEEAKQVKEAFDLGYTALNHHIRNGEKTVSWYRGALVPLSYPKLESYTFLPSADAALRYNYQTGFLDISYAAAWQLGRLLALQNQHFAQAMYRYRNRGRLQTKSAIKQSELKEKYRLSAENLEDEVIQVLTSKQGQKGLQTLGS